VQREITAAALSDPEVLDALGAREPDLGGYLVSQGFAARGLLAGPSATVTEEEGGGTDAGGLMGEGDGKDPLVALLESTVRGLEWAGARIADLGTWLRDRLAPPTPERAEEADDAAEGAAAGTKPRPRGRASGPFGPGGVLEKVGTVAVLIVLLVVFKKAGLAGLRPRA
jgi:hypothetical protein